MRDVQRNEEKERKRKDNLLGALGRISKNTRRKQCYVFRNVAAGIYVNKKLACVFARARARIVREYVRGRERGGGSRGRGKGGERKKALYALLVVPLSESNKMDRSDNPRTVKDRVRVICKFLPKGRGGEAGGDDSSEI